MYAAKHQYTDERGMSHVMFTNGNDSRTYGALMAKYGFIPDSYTSGATVPSQAIKPVSESQFKSLVERVEMLEANINSLLTYMSETFVVDAGDMEVLSVSPHPYSSGPFDKDLNAVIVYTGSVEVFGEYWFDSEVEDSMSNCEVYFRVDNQKSAQKLPTLLNKNQDFICIENGVDILAPARGTATLIVDKFTETRYPASGASGSAHAQVN
jgi:hypothetical protein